MHDAPSKKGASMNISQPRKLALVIGCGAIMQACYSQQIMFSYVGADETVRTTSTRLGDWSNFQNPVPHDHATGQPGVAAFSGAGSMELSAAYVDLSSRRDWGSEYCFSFFLRDSNSDWIDLDSRTCLHYTNFSYPQTEPSSFFPPLSLDRDTSSIFTLSWRATPLTLYERMGKTFHHYLLNMSREQDPDLRLTKLGQYNAEIIPSDFDYYVNIEAPPDNHPNLKYLYWLPNDNPAPAVSVAHRNQNVSRPWIAIGKAQGVNPSDLASNNFLDKDSFASSYVYYYENDGIGSGSEVDTYGRFVPSEIDGFFDAIPSPQINDEDVPEEFLLLNAEHSSIIFDRGVFKISLTMPGLNGGKHILLHSATPGEWSVEAVCNQQGSEVVRWLVPNLEGVAPSGNRYSDFPMGFSVPAVEGDKPVSRIFFGNCDTAITNLVLPDGAHSTVVSWNY